MLWHFPLAGWACAVHVPLSACLWQCQACLTWPTFCDLEIAAAFTTEHLYLLDLHFLCPWMFFYLSNFSKFQTCWSWITQLSNATAGHGLLHDTITQNRKLGNGIEAFGQCGTCLSCNEMIKNPWHQVGLKVSHEGKRNSWLELCVFDFQLCSQGTWMLHLFHHHQQLLTSVTMACPADLSHKRPTTWKE